MIHARWRRNTRQVVRGYETTALSRRCCLGQHHSWVWVVPQLSVGGATADPPGENAFLKISTWTRSYIHCAGRVAVIILDPRVASLTEESAPPSCRPLHPATSLVVPKQPHFCFHLYRRTASRISSSDAHLAPKVVTSGSTFPYR